jgi:hypothetical protein
MFENLNQDQGQNLSGQTISSNPTPPANFPPQAPKVEDMFADVKDVAPAKNSSAMPKMAIPSTTAGKNSGGKILRTLIGIIIILVIIAAGLFLAGKYAGSAAGSNFFSKFSNLTSIFKKSAPVNPSFQTEEPVTNQPENTTEVPNNTATTVNEFTVDTDGDGLTDVEEASLGTDSLNADTDSDGLTDYQEIKIYHTNPLNKDTDSDGFEDGAEVQAGYNPNGPGKLAPQ